MSVTLANQLKSKLTWWIISWVWVHKYQLYFRMISERSYLDYNYTRKTDQLRCYKGKPVRFNGILTLKHVWRDTREHDKLAPTPITAVHMPSIYNYSRRSWYSSEKNKCYLCKACAKKMIRWDSSSSPGCLCQIPLDSRTVSLEYVLFSLWEEIHVMLNWTITYWL